MCMIELATKTITADSRMGAHSEVSGTIFPSVRAVVYARFESLHLAFGSRSNGSGGSSVVREGGGAYTVERLGAQLANEVNNVRTSLVRGPGRPYRLQTDWARRGPARDVIGGAGLA